MKRRHAEIAAGLVVAAAGLLLTFVAGLWGYMSFTATPLHPAPNEVSAVTGAAPGQPWAGAVDHARQIVRAALVDQNLPGVSVAVAAGDEILWTEGFGWA